MTQLARSLEQVVALPVVDRTNLNGIFDIDLQWGSGTNDNPVSTLRVNEQAALLTAIREQMGLRLQTRRAPHDVIVIDAVSQTTPH